MYDCLYYIHIYIYMDDTQIVNHCFPNELKLSLPSKTLVAKFLGKIRSWIDLSEDR